MGFTIPFCTWLLMGYFMSIPIELEEAALVDGCTRLGVLFRIVLPISLPALAVVAFFSFTLSWNEYLYAIVFNSDPHVLTIPTGLSNFIVEDVFFWGPIMASTALTVIPPLAGLLLLPTLADHRPDHGGGQGVSPDRQPQQGEQA